MQGLMSISPDENGFNHEKVLNTNVVENIAMVLGLCNEDEYVEVCIRIVKND